MEYLFICKKVERSLESLKQSGKQGYKLAQKATRIIESIRLGNLRSHVDVTGKCTKYGEKRIKNCQKYDLGSGYRLITIQRGPKIFVTFFGTHDECQRWLENNSRLQKITSGNAAVFSIAQKNQIVSNQTENGLVPPDNDVDDDFLEELSDKDLRTVFSGLVEGLKK